MRQASNLKVRLSVLAKVRLKNATSDAFELSDKLRPDTSLWDSFCNHVGFRQ